MYEYIKMCVYKKIYVKDIESRDSQSIGLDNFWWVAKNFSMIVRIKLHLNYTIIKLFVHENNLRCHQ
jgi:hypothetical protein